MSFEKRNLKIYLFQLQIDNLVPFVLLMHFVKMVFIRYL